MKTTVLLLASCVSAAFCLSTQAQTRYQTSDRNDGYREKNDRTPVYYPEREKERRIVTSDRVPEARLRIKAVSRRDHALAHDYINALSRNRALSPSGPPIDLSIRNGKLHLYGTIESSQEHRALVDIAHRVPGVIDVQDELKGR